MTHFTARDQRLLGFIPAGMSTPLAWLLVLLFAAASIAEFPLSALGNESQVVSQGILFTLIYGSFVAIGALLALKVPHNPLGWIFLCLGSGAMVGNSLQSYVEIALSADPRGLPVGPWTVYIAWYAALAWPLSMALMLYLPILFPDGRPAGRWGKLLLILATVGYVTLFLDYAFKPGRLDVGRLSEDPIINPFGWEAGWEYLGLLSPLMLGLLVGFIGGVVLLLVRAKRSTGIGRQQFKWFGFGALATLVFVFGLQNLVPLLYPAVRENEIIGNLIFGIGIAILPISMGIAVLRFRLYDLGRIVNRAAVYAVLTIVLAVIYLGGVTLIQAAVSPITGQSDLAVAASTLVVAALFRPLRTRIQAFIDHRFYRRKYDADRTVEQFSSKLRDEIDLTALNDELVGVVYQTMHPTHVSIWLRPQA